MGLAAVLQDDVMVGTGGAGDKSDDIGGKKSAPNTDNLPSSGSLGLVEEGRSSSPVIDLNCVGSGACCWSGGAETGFGWSEVTAAVVRGAALLGSGSGSGAVAVSGNATDSSEP